MVAQDVPRIVHLIALSHIRSDVHGAVLNYTCLKMWMESTTSTSDPHASLMHRPCTDISYQMIERMCFYTHQPAQQQQGGITAAEREVQLMVFKKASDMHPRSSTNTSDAFYNFLCQLHVLEEAFKRVFVVCCA
jgi:hypothetical protein